MSTISQDSNVLTHWDHDKTANILKMAFSWEIAFRHSDISSGKGLLLEGNKPLPEPMLSNHWYRPVTITGMQDPIDTSANVAPDICHRIDGSEQDCSISIANAQEIL